MPPRSIVAIIVTFWLGSIALLIYREYWPWWRTDAPPLFLVELADEAAPLVAQWSIYRGDQKVGSVTTTMTCLKDESIELASTIDNLEINMPSIIGTVQIRVGKLHTVQRVTRKGELLGVNSHLQVTIKALGLKIEIKTAVDGVVRDGNLYAKCSLDSPFGRTEQDLEPIALQMGNVLNPMQPIARIPVRPGQHWKMTNVDPLGEALNAVVPQMLQQMSKSEAGKFKLKASLPKVFLAKVNSEPREWKYDRKSVSCYVIEYRSEDSDVSGSTWVSVEDGKVMRQEMSNLGDKFVLEREN